MSKATKTAKKNPPRKPAAKRVEIKKFLEGNELKELRAFDGVPVTGYGSMFNPSTGSGSIRISFAAAPPKDFNNLPANVFAATLEALRSGQSRYNGQYILAIS